MNKIIHDSYNANPIEKYSYSYTGSEDPTKNEQLKSSKWKNNKVPETAELIIDNFKNFDYKNYVYRPFGADNEHCYYEDVDICDTQMSGCTNIVDAYGYIWNKADIKMISL